MKLLSLGLIAASLAAVLVESAAIPERRSVATVKDVDVKAKGILTNNLNCLRVKNIANNAKVNVARQ
ncbi:hypothetical protein G6F62_012780 [Rhizopus arrhizus]|nr:hypothetical protein G6F62_012780 [Rhizopus arrhizus]